MFQLKDEECPKLRPWTSIVLVFNHTVVLLLLPHGCTGQPRVIGPSEPILASVGEDIILPCHVSPAVDAASTAVEWTRPDLKPRFVHLWRSGQELLDNQHPSYKGRTSLFINSLKHGNISLKLSNVRSSDEGTYRCFIPTMKIDSTVKLVFGSVSSPDIEISKISNGVMLHCKCEGQYLEPEVFWLDGEGNLLSAGPPETVRGPDDLYTVSSRVTVEKRHSNGFTCGVTEKKTKHSRDVTIHVPDDLFMVQSNSAVRISICVLLCIVAVGTLFFLVWRRGPNKTKTTNISYELQPLMGVDSSRLQTMEDNEKVKYLEKIKVKLDEDLKKTEGEIEDAEQVIKTLTEQKTDLKEQREKLIKLQQEGRLQLEEKKVKRDQTSGIRKGQKEDYEKRIRNLQRKDEEHVELIKTTDKLLETTESLIIKMTERKGKLEGDKEQIHRNLTDIERQREEIQKKLQPETETERNNQSYDGY